MSFVPSKASAERRHHTRKQRCRGAGIRHLNAVALLGLGTDDADGDRATQFQHTNEGMNGDVHLGRPTPVRARSQTVTDHLLEPADGCSARARFVYPEAFCQTARPCSPVN